MHSGYQKLAYNHTFVKKIRRLFKKPLFWGTFPIATSNPKADSERPRKTALVGGVKHIYMASIADFRPNNRRMELYPSSYWRDILLIIQYYWGAPKGIFLNYVDKRE